MIRYKKISIKIMHYFSGFLVRCLNFGKVYYRYKSIKKLHISKDYITDEHALIAFLMSKIKYSLGFNINNTA